MNALIWAIRGAKVPPVYNVANVALLHTMALSCGRIRFSMIVYDPVC